jgi:Skp family chaperone for outer membrane proteins
MTRLAAIILLGFAATTIAQTGNASGGTRIGVINIAKIFAEYEMTRQLEQRFDSERRAVADDAEKKRQLIVEKQQGLAPFKPDSQAYRDRSTELTRLQVEYEVELTMREQQLKDAHKQSLLTIYRDVQAAVERIARQRGIDVVLTYDELDSQAPDSNALRQQILLKKVIYSNEQTDLTQVVLTDLNAAFTGGANPNQPNSTQPGQNPHIIQSTTVQDNQ